MYILYYFDIKLWILIITSKISWINYELEINIILNINISFLIKKNIHVILHIWHFIYMHTYIHKQIINKSNSEVLIWNVISISFKFFICITVAIARPAHMNGHLKGLRLLFMNYIRITYRLYIFNQYDNIVTRFKKLSLDYISRDKINMYVL